MFTLNFWTHFRYYPLKMWLLHETSLPHPVLHIYLGLLIQFGICVLLRKRISHPMPLYFVYFAELYNEIHDTLHGAGEINRAFAWGYMLDYLHTIIIPTILFLLARYTSILMRSNTDT